MTCHARLILARYIVGTLYSHAGLLVKLDFFNFLCTSVFLRSFYAFQIVLFVVQLGSVVHWRAAEGLIPATVLRRWAEMVIGPIGHEFLAAEPVAKKYIGLKYLKEL